MSDQWAIVELMGHVRTAGRISEEQRFGGTMGRLDIPTGDASGEYVTTYFHASSVYRITFASESAARAVAKQNEPEPVKGWEMPQLLGKPRETISMLDDDDEDRPY